VALIATQRQCHPDTVAQRHGRAGGARAWVDEARPVVRATRHQVDYILRAEHGQRERARRARERGHHDRAAGPRQRAQRAHELARLRHVLDHLGGHHRVKLRACAAEEDPVSRLPGHHSAGIAPHDAGRAPPELQTQALCVHRESARILPGCMPALADARSASAAGAGDGPARARAATGRQALGRTARVARGSTARAVQDGLLRARALSATSCSAVAARYATASSGSAAACARATPIDSALASAPVTSAPRRASASASSPPPQPTSSTARPASGAGCDALRLRGAREVTAAPPARCPPGPGLAPRGNGAVRRTKC